MSVALATPSKCPICGAAVPGEALECPRCGELFAPAPIVDDGPADETESSSGARERFLYYTGIVLILLGGPGIALGSWLHDALRVSFLNYNSFDVFGPVNRLVLAVGLVVMIVGIVFLILSLRLSRPAQAELP